MKPLALIVLALVIALTLPAVAQQPLDNTALWELYSNGHHGQALDRAQLLLADHPQDRDLRHLLGRCLFDLGRPDEAREHLKFCVTDSPPDWRYAWSQFYLGGLAATRGDDDECRRLWTAVRDDSITRNVARNAANNLRAFGLDESMAHWPVRDTEHLHLVFSPALPADQLDRYAEAHEDAWHELTEAFGGAPEYRTRYIVWSSLDEARREAGIRSLGFAKPEYNLIHCLWNQTLGHELAHVVCHHALQPSERTGFINEGLAVAHDLTGRDQAARARATMGEAGIEAVDVRRCWDDPGSVAGDLLYPVAGGWIQFLLERKGRPTVLELGRNQTRAHAESVLGDEFATLVAEYEATLNGG